MLITRLLTRKAIDGIQPRIEQIREVVPKAARFRRTASRTGDLIPTQRQVLSRNAGRGIDEDQPSCITDLVQLDHRAVRGWDRQRDRREFLDLLDEVDVLSGKVPIPIGGPGWLNQPD